MSKIKYTVKTTSQFKKDYKLAMKRNLNISLLKEVVTLLSMGEKLPEKYRECHISPDWLLIYRFENDILVLTLSRTGSHSDLLDKWQTAV